MMMTAELLDVRQFSVHYGAARAAEQIHLTVSHGETVALLGANGAGKSSILKGIAGLVEARGELIFDGQDISRHGVQERFRRGIVYVPEGREIVSALSVAENLALGGYFLSRAARSARRDMMLGLFPEIADRLHAPAWMLSGGEQQMLAIGRGLMSKPRLLLLDEPSLGLAPLLVRRVFERLLQIKAESGLSILLVEQNLRMTMKVAQVMYFMRNGSIVGQRRSSDLETPSDREAVLEAYLGTGRSSKVAPLQEHIR
jgi:branched-chain amino acid transport system ATP-binding protein